MPPDALSPALTLNDVSANILVYTAPAGADSDTHQPLGTGLFQHGVQQNLRAGRYQCPAAYAETIC